jgi:8-oxo-dGTP pyrophosphatase MutT (NUDIX family)
MIATALIRARNGAHVRAYGGPEYRAAMRRPMRPNEISSGGVVVRRSGNAYEVCLVSDGRHWGFPKGLIEPGETPEAAALREISEETGIPTASLALKAPLPPAEYVYRKPNGGALVFKHVHHFVVEVPEGTELHPDPAEIAEAAWLGFDVAKARLSFRNSIEVLEAARSVLEPHASQEVPATEP